MGPFVPMGRWQYWQMPPKCAYTIGLLVSCQARLFSFGVIVDSAGKLVNCADYLRFESGKVPFKRMNQSSI